MLRKFFPRDKNYILEQAQLSLQNSLLNYLLDYVKVEHLLHHNPLGIIDDTVLRIKGHVIDDFQHLHDFYISLAGVFRYLHYSDNQLQFPFDGKDEFERYQLEWTLFFKQQCKQFCRHDSFRRAILDLTVFYPQDYTPQMAGLRLSAYITKFFELRIDPQKGILKKGVA